MESDSSIKHLSTKKFIDPETGDVTYKYFWKRNPVPAIHITGTLPDQLSGYTLIKKDLYNALIWLDIIDGMLPSLSKKGNFVQSGDRIIFNHVKGLFVAALTFYAKCYTAARGRHAQVNRKWLDKEHRELHDYYMNLRHNFAAHSGDEKVELAKTYVLLHPKKKNEYLHYLSTVRVQPDFTIAPDGEKGFRELINYTRKLVEEKHQKLCFKVIEENILPEGIDFWRQKHKKGLPVKIEVRRNKNG